MVFPPDITIPRYASQSNLGNLYTQAQFIGLIGKIAALDIAPRAAADRQAETERAAPQPAAEELDPEALKRARQEAAAKRSQ